MPEEPADVLIIGAGASGGVVGLRLAQAGFGPVTTETLRQHGLEPHVEAERHDVDGVVAAILRDATA